ncbi:hypothetical protein FA13DRAFT_1706361 [Coprinellus micaceus]|uniref:Uncharacterized protein n=1 Tax=Coprinellus micaceus TaxID=71717 RepID=A0A4Y7TQ16_COPMI|nr:hypothetical protein FA13DRAFT_1706361 [Coprinellus micaceus]
MPSILKRTTKESSLAVPSSVRQAQKIRSRAHYSSQLAIQSIYGFVEYGNGTSPLVTLAPEARSASQLRYLADEGSTTCEVAWVPTAQLEGNEDDRHIRLPKQEDNLKEVQGNEWRVQLFVQPTATNPTTIVQSTTNPATIVQSTSTSHPSPTATTIGVGNENIMDLLRFIPDPGIEGKYFPPETHEVVIGPPVSNCKQVKGGSNSIKSTIGDTYELGHSFSVEIMAGVSAGLGFAGASVSTTINRGVEEKTTQSHSTEIPIPAGQIGFLVANISYRVTPGVLKIGDGVRGYEAVYIACGSGFPALNLPGTNCNISASHRSMPQIEIMKAWVAVMASIILVATNYL